MTEEALQDIYLNNFHKSNNAKFVPFAGYNMPINYESGIINEHIHVRTHAGLFDVSHMCSCQYRNGGLFLTDPLGSV